MERSSLGHISFWLLPFLFLSVEFVFPNTGYPDIKLDVEYDQVSFKLLIGRDEIGSIENICREEEVYICLSQLLDLLGYPYQWKSEENLFSSCCPDSKHCFSIHKKNITYNDSIYTIPDSLIIFANDNLYLHTSCIKSICSFNLSVIFQSLKIKVDDNIDFPVIRLRDQEVKRKRILSGKENIQLHNIDTLPLKMCRLNSIGYALSTNISGKGLDSYNTILSANGEFLKGALNVNFNHADGKNYNADQFTFKLDYTLQKKNLKQITFFRDYNAFKMNLEGYSTGVYISNDNTSFFNKRYYLYKGKTRPNTDVEIYNNKTLVSFVSADSLGYYEAIIPVSGGTNTISAVTFNSYGESISDDRIVYMPVNIEPYKKFKYVITSGYSDSNQLFAGLSMAYGLTSFLTVTGDAEAILNDGKLSGIVGVGFKSGWKQWLQTSANYFPFVKYELNLTGNLHRYFGYNILYEQYTKGQRLILNAPIRNLQLDLSTEIPIRLLQNNLSLSIRQMNYNSGNYFSSYIRGNLFVGNYSISTHVTSNAQQNFKIENITFGGRLGYRVNKRIYNDFNYDYFTAINDHRVNNRLQYQFATKLFGTINLQYFTKSKNVTAEIGVIYRLPCVTVGNNIRVNNQTWSDNSSVSGGFNRYVNNKVDFSNRNLSGSSLHIVLFVDINGNEKYDAKEEIVQDAKVIVKTGAETYKRKTGIYFRNISPYYAFKLIIPRQSFKDISWQITPVEKAICLLPYQSRSLYFPVKVISEVSGNVFKISKGKQVCLKNILITITHRGTGNVIKVLTDEWGYYSYLGLTAGSYEITLDSDLKMNGERILHADIPESSEGIQLEGFDFEICDK